MPEILGGLFCAAAAFENAHAMQAMARNENERTRPVSVPTIEVCMNDPSWAYADNEDALSRSETCREHGTFKCFGSSAFLNRQER